MKVAFIGLGVMGGPMAGHLAKAGHDLRVFNRTPEKAKTWVETYGGEAFATAAEAALGCEALVTCVGADADVRSVVTACLGSLAPGAVIIDHTTTSAKLAREMADLSTHANRGFLDAPVSGGEAGAKNGQLSIMVGGETETVAKATPVMQVYAKAIKHMGQAGSGQLTKMVNQICIAGVVQGLAEAVAFSKAAGLDADLVLEAISKGAAQSWQMENRWPTMARGEFEFGFAVDWMRKDLGLVLDEARANGSRVEVTALVDQFYAEVQAMGGRRWDTSSLAARLTKS
jgi:3-hydroxyisobutyrate dehydrogenase